MMVKGSADTGKPYVYVVTAQNGAEEPIVTVFNKQDSASRCLGVFKEMYDRAWMDTAPLYSEFITDAG